jgi:radical SAM protein with 4Fe4S-binding SPASM domain
MGFVRFKGEFFFNKNRLAINELEEIKKIVIEYRSLWPNKEIHFSGYVEENSMFGGFEERKLKFSNRAKCNGNLSSIFILPDGKVTYCEQLYWIENFIIGDISNSTIKEVWQSSKARSKYYRLQNEYRPVSPCHTCLEFKTCHYTKGVCYKDIIEAYGEENWDFPDPRCPKAPEIVTKMFY